MPKRTLKQPEVKMGGKPVELRIWKAEDRIMKIEQRMELVFSMWIKRFNTHPDKFWDSWKRVQRLNKTAAKTLNEFYLQRALHQARLEFYLKLLHNQID